MDAVFEAPGPGTWELDRSHYDSGITPIIEEVASTAAITAYRETFARTGVPADGIEFKAVNGFVYARVRPLFGADSTSERTPPDWVIKLMGRIHPEMRRREKRAKAQILSGESFRRTIKQWNETIKPAQLARNSEFQAVDLEALDDAGVADHVEALIAYNLESNTLHHVLHTDDLGPLGLFVVHCRDHGIETSEAVQALIGASPSTSEPLRKLAAIRKAVEAAGATPSTLDDVRAVSPGVAAQLDGYLARHGAVLYSGYDIDSPTLLERPDVVFAAIMSATTSAEDDDRGDRAANELRSRVPESERFEFDRLLADARLAMDMRDDNGPLTAEWPGGLLRLAMVEAGRRLAERGAVTEADHVFELSSKEIGPLLRTGTGPTPQELADRAIAREASRSLDPPPYLGAEPVDPPLHLLPPSMAKAMDLVQTLIQELFGAESTAPLTGTGIGATTYVGTARTAETAEEAIATMEDGDILVTRATSPAFNLVLAIAGGLVTVHGGAMCHAAVLSRELGLPAVIGVADCLEHIRTGDRVEINPEAGTVTVLS